jgi:hypothetical protein
MRVYVCTENRENELVDVIEETENVNTVFEKIHFGKLLFRTEILR